jgi:hypothetical protein
MYVVIPLILILLLTVVLYIRNKNRFISKAGWNHFFDGFQFSSSDFYRQVEAGINERQLSIGVVDSETFFEGGIISSRREYLKISHNEHVFYVCAAKFGTGIFVSQWSCIKKEGWIEHIPIVSKLLGKDRNDKSFYQMDTESMYKSAIHNVVLSVLDSFTAAKGIRALTEFERQYNRQKS